MNHLSCLTKVSAYIAEWLSVIESLEDPGGLGNTSYGGTSLGVASYIVAGPNYVTIGSVFEVSDCGDS